MNEPGTARRASRGRSGTLRTAEVLALLSLALAMTGMTALGACSSDGASSFLAEAGADGSSGSGYDAGAGDDAPAMIVSDDSGFVALDAAPPPACPGSSVPEDAASGACVLDNSEGCPSCAPWGFACAGGIGPAVQVGSASSFCHAIPADDAGILVCCTHPACIVSTASGPCDASAQTRYECSGTAVPTGTCDWLGATAPNDYCCQ
jgi:hypothetical protein